jgi:hypothetical protein
MSKLWITLAVALAAGIAPVWAELKVEQVQKLLADDGAAEDRFGRSIAVDRSTVVIGARLADNSGAAYVFTLHDGTWTQQAKLLAEGPGSRSFATSVAIDGDTALIGSSYQQPAGSAFVFTRRGGVWGQDARLAFGAYNGFGHSVAISNDAVFVGAPIDSFGTGFGESAYVYTGQGGVWTSRNALRGRPGDGFGSSVAFDGDTAVIGAPLAGQLNANSGGSAYIFTRQANGNWTQQAHLRGDDSLSRSFGTAVAIDGDTVLIGDPRHDVNGGSPRVGAAYVFTREHGTWTQMDRLMAHDGRILDGFGLDVALDGTTAMIGTMRRTAYIFSSDGATWTQQAQLDGDFGVTVALEGDTAFVGGPGDATNGFRSGSVYVFRILRDPVDLIDALAGEVHSLNLHHGTENSLLVKLDAALLILTDLSEDNDHAAAKVLGAFINQVEAEYGKKIGPADADRLIADAQRIVGLLESDE